MKDGEFKKHPATVAAQAAHYLDPATGGITPPLQPLRLSVGLNIPQT